MTDEVLFRSESSKRCIDVAEYLRTVADRLERGETITLIEGEQSVTLDPPERASFEVTAEREGSDDESGELSLEFELEWPEGASGEDADGLSIE